MRPGSAGVDRRGDVGGDVMTLGDKIVHLTEMLMEVSKIDGRKMSADLAADLALDVVRLSEGLPALGRRDTVAVPRWLWGTEPAEAWFPVLKSACVLLGCTDNEVFGLVRSLRERGPCSLALSIVIEAGRRFAETDLASEEWRSAFCG